MLKFNQKSLLDFEIGPTTKPNVVNLFFPCTSKMLTPFKAVSLFL